MSNEDIKMSGVFDLPFSVEASGMIVDKEAFVTADICGSMSHSKAAAHAINNHDPMAFQIKELKAALLEVLNTCEVDYAIGKGRHSELMKMFDGESK